MKQAHRWRYAPTREQKFRRFWDYFFVCWFIMLGILAIAVGYTVVHFVLKFW